MLPAMTRLPRALFLVISWHIEEPGLSCKVILLGNSEKMRTLKCLEIVLMHEALWMSF